MGWRILRCKLFWWLCTRYKRRYVLVPSTWHSDMLAGDLSAPRPAGTRLQKIGKWSGYNPVVPPVQIYHHCPQAQAGAHKKGERAFARITCRSRMMPGTCWCNLVPGIICYVPVVYQTCWLYLVGTTVKNFAAAAAILCVELEDWRQFGLFKRLVLKLRTCGLVD